MNCCCYLQHREKMNIQKLNGHIFISQNPRYSNNTDEKSIDTLGLQEESAMLAD